MWRAWLAGDGHRVTGHAQGGDPRQVSIPCRDGVILGAHIWPAAGTDPGHGSALGGVIINPATGVLARYYHRYARFLTSEGFDVLTYDYRGIGLSRPDDMRTSRYRWREWGEQDCDAALRFLRERSEGPLMVVGHSIGGFLPGMAQSAPMIHRMLTMGAQYAWWGDYLASRRLALFWKWHVRMPAITLRHGYFPGRRMGWLEDLPARVAHEWSFRGPRFESSYPRGERSMIVARMAAVTAPILAVAVSDDELGTLPAIRRGLRYYTGAPRTLVSLSPADCGRDSIGHFSLFHTRHRDGFWEATAHWLRGGQNPWPDRVVPL